MDMLRFLFLVGVAWLISAACTQAPPAISLSDATIPPPAGTLIKLWTDGVPDCPVDSAYRVEVLPGRGRKTMAVQEPEIEVFLPPTYRATGRAVLILPGGGYYLQAYDWEGTEFAKWFNRRGITACVLKYRLPHWSGEGCREHVAYDDATRAMRLIRSRADELGILPDQIGVMGFSAGGHLASTIGTHFDLGQKGTEDPLGHISSRPDFLMLIYPVISGDSSISHKGSFRNLLGTSPDPALLDYFSTERHVTANTPPTFLLHAADDPGVPVENSLRFYQALIDHDVPAEMHLFPTGGHGFALAEDHAQLRDWPELLSSWLEQLPE